MSNLHICFVCKYAKKATTQSPCNSCNNNSNWTNPNAPNEIWEVHTSLGGFIQFPFYADACDFVTKLHQQYPDVSATIERVDEHAHDPVSE